MTVKELIDTCQNQWKQNSLFECKEQFQIEINTKTYYWKKLRNMNHYLLELENQEVAWWEMQNEKLVIATNKYEYLRILKCYKLD